jgi:hypothetical protein
MTVYYYIFTGLIVAGKNVLHLVWSFTRGKKLKNSKKIENFEKIRKKLKVLKNSKQIDFVIFIRSLEKLNHRKKTHNCIIISRYFTIDNMRKASIVTKNQCYLEDIPIFCLKNYFDKSFLLRSSMSKKLSQSCQKKV